MAPSYFFKETFVGLKRNGLVAFAAISTVFIALFLLGGALLMNTEVNKLIDRTEANIEVAVFLRDDISQSQQQHLNDKLNAMPEVDSVHYESKEEAYARFIRLFHDQQALIQNTSK